MTTHSKEQDYVSRSALAEKLSTPLKELTQLMIEAGWIIQEGKQWQLTAKGEFEGGQYRQSDKYGQYIVWPVAIVEHPVIRDADKGLVTITSLAKPLAIPPRLFNRLLAEFGWIESFAKGWQLTQLGKSLGGVQQHDAETGVPYVMWPREIKSSTTLTQGVSLLMGEQSLSTLDGRQLTQKSHCLLSNWLYLLGFSYGYQRSLGQPNGDQITPDFYLPSHSACIDIYEQSLPPTALAARLNKQEAYNRTGWQNIEVTVTDIAALDHDLTRALVQLGISVY